ncbi:MAG: heparan-alpha-glucosaminide N-acetyltransferase domain-containing protein [Gammaproteobacteria bacterium]|nr:heparan-alpha-glucosaminide N-acetyltransferase domain-containing protein [Gammaproteobacteria bacterium]
MTSAQKSLRLDGLDLARFVAFAGMVVVNFKIVMGAEGNGGVLGLLSGALEGRAAATFVVLAGIGLGLSAIRGGHAQLVSVTIKRAVFLLVIGLLNSLIFDADILHYYAFYFLIGVSLLRFETRSLIAVIVLLNVMFVLMVFILNYDTGWNWDNYSYSDFWTPAGFVRNLFFNGWHPVIPWLGFLLFGFVLSRMSLSQTSTQNRLVLLGGVSLALAELASSLLAGALGALDPELEIFATTKPIPPMPLYMLAGCGAASLVIGLCLRFAKLMERLGILKLVVPAGRQTLTLYVAHILIGMGTLEALGMLENQTASTAVAAALVFCLLAALYALVYAKFFKRGPLEAAMRKIAG